MLLIYIIYKLIVSNNT
ncbi:hypothetical protein [Escherichia coli]